MTSLSHHAINYTTEQTRLLEDWIRHILVEEFKWFKVGSSTTEDVRKKCEEFGLHIEMERGAFPLPTEYHLYKGTQHIRTLRIPYPVAPAPVIDKQNKLERLPVLTPEEESVYNHIDAAWVKFIKLQQTHPSDIPEFHRAIHDLQKLIAMRVSRREHPELWPDKSEHCKPKE